MVKAKKFVVAKRFVGEAKPSDFQLQEEELPPLKDGEVLCESLWLSVDPYVRAYVLDEGKIVPGSVVARVAESRSPDFPVGSHLVGFFGWRTWTVYQPAEPWEGAPFPKPYLLPDFGDLPLSLAVGVLGLPGVTANHAFLERCSPRRGETVVVTTAAGAVGSLVGQMAKMVGCRVVGFAGSDAKVRWVKEKLGFDAAYNYKTTTAKDALKEACPDGVDCYFDNVGGEFSNDVMRAMNKRGRVVVCGAISGYNAGFEVSVGMVQPLFLFKELKMEGYLIWNDDRWMEAIEENMRWIKEGKLVYEETITKGFENTPQALIGMLRGDNTGKALVKI